MKKVSLVIALTLVLSIGMFGITFPGTWDINFDWSGSDDYRESTITFHTNYTFTVVDTVSHDTLYGTWFKQDATRIIFIFDNGTAYAGTRVGGAMVGMMGDPNYNVDGGWYAVKHPDNQQVVSSLYYWGLDGTHIPYTDPTKN